MARDFKVELDNVEMINGSDDLLKDTKVTKVTITGENKLNSLNSTFENCTELTIIEGEINLDGVSDMTEMALNTTLNEIKVTNPTEENIQADNSLNQVANVKIGGTKYSKGGVQDVVGSLEWNAENFTYEDTILDNVYTNSSSIEDNKNITVSDTLEQKATSIEITGQTYENLVNGKATKNLLDEMSMQQTEGKPTQFTPHMEQPICLEYIEGQTYKNLIEGKGEYKLTDTFSTTWTESNNGIENPPSMIEIPEIFGNTVQGYANVLTPYVIKEHWEKANWITNATIVNKYTINTTSAPNSGNLESAVSNDNSLAIQLKANTTYTLKIECPSFGNTSYMRCIGENGNTGDIIVNLAGIKGCFIQKFTTTSTGKITFGVRPDNSSSSKDMKVFCVEGDVDLSLYDFGEFDLEYIQSVGDLYVDESGEPILDEDGNEQYKLEIESSNNINLVDSNGWIEKSTTEYYQIIQLEPNTDYIYYGNQSSTLSMWQGLIYCDSEGSESTIIYDAHKYVSYIHRFTTDSANLYVKVYYSTSLDTIQTQCLPMLVKGSKVLPYIEGTGNNQSNKTTILMPQPLSRAGYERTSPSNSMDNLNLPIRDKLYYDINTNKFFIQKFVFRDIDLNYSFEEDVSNNNFWKKQATKPIETTQTYRHVSAIRFSLSSPLSWSYIGDSLGKGQIGIIRLPKSSYPTIEDCNAVAGNVKPYYSYYKNDTELYYEIIETKILEKPSLDAYSPKTYITTSSEVQPSQMAVTNKKVDFIPLGLQPNKDYTLQLDSIGKDDKPITVNLGGTETTIQPTNDTNTHHKVVVRTPNELTTDKLDLSGEGVVVNDVMLFEGGGNEIKQEVEYVEGIQNIGELQEDGTYKIDILTTNGNKIFDADTWVNSTLGSGILLNSGYYKVLGSNMIEIIANDTRTSDTIRQIQLKPNTKYSILCSDASLIIYIFFKLQATGQISGRSKIDFTTDETGRIGFKIPNGVGKIVKIDIVDEKGFNYSAWSIQSILLPQPLRKIGGIKDKFYWDEDKGHYCIEQNIDENLEVLDTPNIIDLLHLNKKYSLDTYMPTTYLECPNSLLQPYKLLLEDDTVRYKSTIEPSTLYTIQFNCVSKLTTKLTLDLGGTRKTVDPIIGVNHVQITTPSELTSDRLFLIGTGIVIKEVIVNKGDMRQYPKYFDGEQSVGELQEDGSYKIVIKTNEGFTVTIRTSSPLTKLDKIYWNNIEKRYEIDRNGVIEVPTVEGDIINLPRLYQKVDTIVNISTDNIEPSKIDISYKDINNN